MNSTTLCLLKESRDVFREILARADWTVLVRISCTAEYESEVRALVKDNTFWHSRLTHLVGEGIMSVLGWSAPCKSINYARVCVLYQRALTETLPARRYFHCAGYLPALLLVELLYDLPKYTQNIGEGSPSELWGAIVELPVLEHALANRPYCSYWILQGTVPVGLSYLLSGCMRTCSIEKNYPVLTEATKVLSSYFKTDGVTPNFVSFLASILQNVAAAGAPAHTTELVATLREISSTMGDPVEYYCAIAKTGNNPVWEAWRGGFRGGNRPCKTVMKLVRDFPAALKFVIAREGPTILKPGEWNRALLSAMKHYRLTSEIGPTILPYCNLSTKKNTVLLEAARLGLEQLTLVLSDPRTRPQKNLEAILTAIVGQLTKKRGFTSTDVEMQLLALTRHEHFNLSELSLAEMKLLSDGLKGRIEQRLSAWNAFNSMYGTGTDLMQLLETGTGSQQEGPWSFSVLDLTLRAITFLDLDARPLVEWMLKSGVQKYYLASRSTVTGVASKDVDVRVLASLLQTISSTRPVLEHMMDLLGTGMSEKRVLLSMQLASLTLGPIELKKRM